MKFCVISLGCKVNQYEGLQIIGVITAAGYEAETSLCRADVYVLNSCSVTKESDAKSRQQIAKFRKLNPNAQIIVVGCSSQNDAEYFREMPGVVCVGGTSSKTALINDFLTQNKHVIRVVRQNLPEAYEHGIFPAADGKTRAYVKIQDGCNNFCSYCIVPYLRGRSRSRSINDVLREIEARGEREIVLTGINLSDYADGLGNLLARLVNFPEKRFRVSSLEPPIISDELLRVWRDSPICRHFHLSMQSGSRAILKAMNRRYDVLEFMHGIELIRKYFPDAGITADIIAGFPGETEQMHRETLETVKTAAFSGGHVFSYSERQGTAAARLAQVPIPERKGRAAEISNLIEQSKAEFIKNMRGKRAVVLSETACKGHTSEYIKAYLPEGTPESKMLCVVLEGAFKDGIKCKLEETK